MLSNYYIETYIQSKSYVYCKYKDQGSYVYCVHEDNRVGKRRNGGRCSDF
jgi:hypothetical protein